MPYNLQNSTVAKATHLIFHLFDVTSARECLLAYRSMYNAFFIDLPVHSFIFADTEKF